MHGARRKSHHGVHHIQPGVGWGPLPQLCGVGCEGQPPVNPHTEVLVVFGPE